MSSRGAQPEMAAGSAPLAPLADVQAKLGHVFRDPALLEEAFRHRSATSAEGPPSYERLEFLGDAIVGFTVCDWLYRRKSCLSEGQMARRRAYLASEPVLALAAARLELSRWITLGESLRQHSGALLPSVLADVYEAVVGAIYTDGGLRAARRFVSSTLLAYHRDIEAPDFGSDHKTLLQEETQARWRVLPAYATFGPIGSDHAPTFESEVSVRGRVVGRGTGKTKKSAEQNAARAALDRLMEEDARDGTANG